MPSSRERDWACAGVFVASFAFYLWTMPPTLPAYRDAGEMASSAWTLGVSHPPSYPLYVLLGRAVMELPIANPAYRLALLSALASAGTLALLCGLLWTRAGPAPALGAALLLGVDASFWSVSVVPEMYSLMLLSAAGLLCLAWRLREGYEDRLAFGLCLLYGVSLGNRTDLLLWAPGLAALALGWPPLPPAPRARRLAWMLGLGLLGLSVYLYLPLRSLRGPWLDWNQPSSPARFLASLTRRGYGGTLDLLSKSYAPGELFRENVAAWGRHLWVDYLGPGLALPVLGAAALWTRDRRALCGLALALLASGPLFLYLANLPPNPHALAIVEPHYLLSDLALAVLASQGLAYLVGVGRPLWAGLCALLLASSFWAPGRWERMAQRWNLTAHDYVRDVMRSLPAGAAVLAKKDVPVFSLWYHQKVEGARPDVRVLAQGLSGSPWYDGGLRRRGLAPPGPLRDSGELRRFAALHSPAYATMDAELPEDLVSGAARGLVTALSSAAPGGLEPWSFFAFRRKLRYESQPDFFNADLAEAYASARQRAGAAAAARGRWEEALSQLRLGWAAKWQAPDAPVYIGFVLFRMGRPAEAAAAYGLALGLFDATLDLTRRYRSLPPVVASIRRGAAEAHVNMGVVLEKLGDRAGAERHYREALALRPGYAQAHYDLAVLHWGRDWALVARELEQTLRLDPGHRDAARYLSAARQRLGK